MKYNQLICIDPGWTNTGVAVWDKTKNEIVTFNIKAPKWLINESPTPQEKNLRVELMIKYFRDNLEELGFIYPGARNKVMVLIEDYTVRHEPKSIKGANTLLFIGALCHSTFGNLISHNEWKKFHNKRLISQKKLTTKFSVPDNEHERDALYMCLATLWEDQYYGK